MPAPFRCEWYEPSRLAVVMLSVFAALPAYAQQAPMQPPVQPPSEQLPGRIDRRIDPGTYGDLSRPLGSVINRIDLPQLPGEAPAEAAKPEARPCDGPSKDENACKR
jgi:hypothetical protein